LSTFFWLPANHNVKNFNKHAAVDLIRFAGNGISRADLATQIGLTRSAVTIIVNDLLINDLVREANSRSTPSGRPPVVLEMNPHRGVVAALDMGATHLSVALADYSAHILNEIEVPFEIARGPESCLREADRVLREMLEAQGLSPAGLSSAGVGVPGPVITEAGTVVSPPIMPGWDGFPIRAYLEKLWGCPVSINNDAELGALGEWAYGAGRGARNLAYLKVGSGIGAGLIINQQIYGGTTGSAGEIGHLTIVENGPTCTCGNQGCLEALAGGRAIAEQARNLARSGSRTLLAGLPQDQIGVRELAEAARRGDLPAQQILSRAGAYIGIAIAGLINLFNPSIVIIGGGVSQVGDLLTVPIRETVRARSLRASGQSANITTAMLGRRSSLMGAIVQALNIAIHNATERKARPHQ